MSFGLSQKLKIVTIAQECLKLWTDLVSVDNIIMFFVLRRDEFFDLQKAPCVSEQ